MEFYTITGSKLRDAIRKFLPVKIYREFHHGKFQIPVTKRSRSSRNFSHRKIKNIVSSIILWIYLHSIYYLFHYNDK